MSEMAEAILRRLLSEEPADPLGSHYVDFDTGTFDLSGYEFTADEMAYLRRLADE